MIQHKTTLSAIASYGTGIGGVALGTWLSENWLQAASLLFMAGTFVVNVYYRIKRDGREAEKHQADMKRNENP